jgi:hypothetical protein
VCDGFPDAMLDIIKRLPRPALAAMTAKERKLLSRFPEVVTIWRGCYEANGRGMSWSLDADVAARFPTLNRYRQEGQPLLIEGLVARDRIVFLKQDRDEQEVVVDPYEVSFVDVQELEQECAA